MTTIVINENTEEGRSLMSLIRAIQKSTDAVVSIHDDELETLPFEEIPGLPYTKEECIASVRKSMEDYRVTGKTYSMEEMRSKHPRIV